MHYLSDLWQALDLGSLESTALRVVSVLLCLVFHEVCHGVAAFFLGDPTAKREHRLSLNPLRHIDWLGVAAMVFTGVGWAKPVPVNPNYFKKPKLGMAITALAGPVSNFLLALWLLWGAKVTLHHAELTHTMYNETLMVFLLNTAVLSISLGLFNLIPFPPLDGSKVAAMFLPDHLYLQLMRYERYGVLILLALSFLGLTGNLIGNAIYEVYMVFFNLFF